MAATEAGQLAMATSRPEITFADLMKLERIDDETFRSIAKPYVPGESQPRSPGMTYGGHVFAQAAWTAAQTVPNGFTLHNISGFFVLAGVASIPFVYRVQNLRNGRSYCTRLVTVTQKEGSGVCFTCTCSFKTAEPNVVDSQTTFSFKQEYGIVLDGKTPEDFDDAPGMDLPWYWQMRKETGHNDAWSGIELKKVDMAKYNDTRSPLERRQLMFYRPLGELHQDANLQLCAHLYASDCSSLFIVANHFEIGHLYKQMGSLVHNVVFHSPMEQMAFPQERGQDWYCKEDYATRLADGRGMFHCRVWSPAGKHIATVTQDGLIRLPVDAKL